MQTAYPLLVILLYTDPGTGALVLQLLAAALIGSMFYLRRFKKAVVVWKDRIRKRRIESGKPAAFDQPVHSGAKLEPSTPASTDPRGTE